MKPPPLAEWVMAQVLQTLAVEGVTLHNSWVIREDEDDALLTLVGVDGRDADVWVDWPPKESEHDDLNVIIVIADGQPFTGTPQELAAWLQGAA